MDIPESLRRIGVEMIYEGDTIMTPDEFSAYKELIDSLPVSLRDDPHSSGEQKQHAGRLHNPVMVRFDPNVNLDDRKGQNTDGCEILWSGHSCAKGTRHRDDLAA